MKITKFFPATLITILALLAFPTLVFGSAPPPNTISLVSASSAGVQGNFPSEDPALSADGHYAAFRSPADNLVTGDSNGKIDIFVRDLLTATTVRVSVDSDGNQADEDSYFPALSATGRYVAFLSAATNLVPGDNKALRDIFVHDRDSDGDGIFDEPGAMHTTLVSTGFAGDLGNRTDCQVLEIPSISANGRYVAFHACFNDQAEVFVHDRDVNENGIFDENMDTSTSWVTVGLNNATSNGPSIFPILSGDGHSVIFRSTATNLVSLDAGGNDNVFLHNLQSGITSLISIAPGGIPADGDSQAGDLSGDGRFVLFSSDASNLVTGDKNGAWDAFLSDTQTGEIKRVSVAPDGSEGDGDSFADSMSSDGRFLVFDSTATNLVSGDTTTYKDVYVSNWPSGSLRRVSIGSQGIEGNGDSISGMISDDGISILFRSNADNLVSNDTNEGPDIFLSQIKLFMPLVVR